MVAALLAPLLLVQAAASASAGELAARASTRLAELEAELVALRHDLHRHPEVSGEEERTARVVADRLAALGLEVRRGVGGHGVVGVLRGGRPGPTVAFRADMDAVRSSAPDPAPYRSTVPGVRHACGHDVHTTIGLALAEGFAAVRPDLSGTLMLLFQPAEETATGAEAMLADGVFEALRPDAIYAVHTAPMEVGVLATAEGTLMAGRDRVTVTLSGAGDLAAAERGVRAALLAASTVPAAGLGESLAGDFAAVRLGAVRPGPAGTRTLTATVTTPSRTASARAREAIATRLAALDRENLRLAHDYTERFVAGVTNDPALTRRAVARVRALLGEDAVLLLDRVHPAFSEDFGSFQARVPGVMFFLGVSNPEAGTVGMPHTPDYVADDAAILVGARALTAVLLDVLERGVPR